MSKQPTQSFEEWQTQNAETDPVSHARAVEAGKAAAKALRPLEGAGITVEQLDEFREDSSLVGKEIASNDRIIGEDTQIQGGAGGGLSIAMKKRNEVLGHVNSRIDHERGRAA